jgi:hypothetical protein
MLDKSNFGWYIEKKIRYVHALDIIYAYIGKFNTTFEKLEYRKGLPCADRHWAHGTLYRETGKSRYDAVTVRVSRSQYTTGAAREGAAQTMNSSQDTCSFMESTKFLAATWEIKV